MNVPAHRAGVRTALRAGLTLAALLPLLAACSTPSAGGSTPAPSVASDAPVAGDAHGAVSGAEEVAEPPLHLVAVGTDGTLTRIDLVDLTSTDLGAVGAPERVATDGRYVFVGTAGGVDIVDSGMWSWDHVDHFHYYRADGRFVGAVPGERDATISAGMSTTTGLSVLTGDAGFVALDNETLAAGAVHEALRVDDTDVTVAAPLGGALIVADATTVTAQTVDGVALGEPVACADPSGSIATRVGTVIGCADGAVLATGGAGGVELTHVALPEGAPAPTTFDGRKGRPTVAGIAGETGFWLFDTRELAWTLIPTDVPLVAVSAVDDAEEHVVAIDSAGRVLVQTADGATAVTEPLVADPLAVGVSLTVDERRAYVADPAERVVFEIDFADGARVAREIALPAGTAFVVEVGR